MGATSKEKLPLKTKLFYASGNIFSGGAFNIINFFYIIFLTDIVGLSMQYIAPILLIGRIWDAVIDPVIGFVTDNTRTRFGRRRPYFLAATFLIFITFFALWFPIAFPHQLEKLIYTLFAYLAFATVFSIVMIPYSALAAELTLDYHERITLNSYCLAFSLASGLACAVLPMFIVSAFPDVRTGYIAMATVFGMLFSLPWIGVFLFTSERSEFSKEKSTFNFLSLFFEPLKIKSFRLFMAMYLFAYLSIDIVSSIFAYYAKYYLKNEEILPIALGVLFVFEILFIPVYDFIAKKTSKNVSYSLGAMVWCMAGVVLFALPAHVSMFQVVLMAAMIGAGVSAVAVMPHAIFADVTDVAELKVGKREEGALSGLMTFMRTVAAGFAVSGVTFSLGMAGFVNPMDGVEQPQPTSFLFAVRFIVAFVPVILLIFGIMAAIRYPLNAKKHEKLIQYLEAKRENKPIEASLENDIADLKKALI